MVGRGAGFGGGVGGISLLTEAKQKVTVHHSVPQVLYIFVYFVYFENGSNDFDETNSINKF